MSNIVILTGFMGSGKTTVGKLLAKKLKYPFVDLDQEIEKNLKMKVAQVFLRKGEPFFRKVEAKILCEVVKTEHSQVIALGGGALIRKSSLNLVNQVGFLIWLKADLKIIMERVGKTDTKRPLIKKDLVKLLQKRMIGYKNSDIKFETGRIRPVQVVEKILNNRKFKKRFCE